MPISKRTEGEVKKRLTLAELVELRKACPPAPAESKSSLAERFLLPPFTVLDARQGYWQKRKKMWLELGIESELGRGEDNSEDAHAVPGGGSGKNSAWKFKTSDGYKDWKERNSGGKRYAKAYNIGMQANKENNWQVQDEQGSGTSIFDPVLCELAYRWFCPRGGLVLDPFAGGSVRGIVSNQLGRPYRGVELRQEQADANRAQAEKICSWADLDWVVGDAVDVVSLLSAEYDFVFSCPPYADLEVYSDDPRDLSNMPYQKFLEVYRRIVAESCSMLRADRFACFVVGDVRSKEDGNYRGFVGDTISAFRAAGLALYNEAVLVTSVGSLPIRVGKQFAKYRKLGKTHQNILVFLKGDAAAASAACGEVDLEDLEMPSFSEGAACLCVEDVRGTLAESYLGGNMEVSLVSATKDEAYLVCDVVRGASRKEERPLPRTWVGVGGQWVRVQDQENLTYLVGGAVYYNRTLFPEAPRPTGAPLLPRRIGV